jgi:hypothetical protein
MWIKTDYDALINTDRLSMIRYDRIMGRTFGFDSDSRLVIADFDATQIIMNGILRGSNLVEVKH